MYEEFVGVSRLKGSWDPHSVTEAPKASFTFPSLRKPCEPGLVGGRKNLLW